MHFVCPTRRASVALPATIKHDLSLKQPERLSRRPSLAGYTGDPTFLCATRKTKMTRRLLRRYIPQQAALHGNDRSLLCSLPREILLMIRSNLEYLTDHVHFSLTSRVLFNLYDAHYWQCACIASGYGITKLSKKKSARLEKLRSDEKAVRLQPWAGLARVVSLDLQQENSKGRYSEYIPF